MDEDDDVTLGVDLDASRALAALADLETRATSFGRAMTGALSGAVVGGKDFDDVLKGLGTRLADIGLKAGLKPLEGLVSSAGASLTAGLGNLFAFAQGGVPGRVTPFADGGVVTRPTLFAMGGGTGLMGEAGSEAILPLQRGADGSLGVSLNGGQAPAQIVFNVTATDAESFRKSEGQITAMLARSVARGRRGT
ncbi:phage tail tape measure protein [Rhizobium halophytocola]|uniref:Phage-related minor tail protein n=1 Tax=Rhizobium halophytocola TaxID=735519 RepID=A0ABS4DYY9_9HYPH|nr:phage tail tape measure protein [Rhizobium halophytocola]MBP1850901.1 phage-related minor tail protein [Rhizobium halophytocola]